MQKELRRSILSGKAYAETSLPLAKRALLMASLTPGQTVISGVQQGKEMEEMVSVCRQLGADIVQSGNVLDIFGIEALVLPEKVDCGTSASTLALAMPLALLFEGKTGFSYSGPQLEKAGAYAYFLSAICGDAPESPSPPKPPFIIGGPLEGSEIAYPAELGTALLCGLAISLPLGQGVSTIGVDGSLPGEGIFEETLSMMGNCGIGFRRIEGRAIQFNGSQAYSTPEQVEVPAKSCEPSYLLLAGALCGKVEVEGLQRLPELEKVFSAFQSNLAYSDGKYLASTGGLLEGGYVDASEAGGFLLHALVLGALSLGKTSIVGMATLRPSQKRHAVLLARELSRMGARITPTDLGMDIEGGNVSGGVRMNPAGNAHVAMACTVAALAARQPSFLAGAECVERGHPNFFRKLALLGGIVRDAPDDAAKLSALPDEPQETEQGPL